MTKPKKLRITTRFQEIISILNQAIDLDGSFLWKSSDKKRFRVPVLVSGISSDQNHIILRQKSIQQGINPGEIVYLKLPIRDSAIKAKVVERVGARITLEFPEQLALDEGRRNPRYYFHPSEEKSIQIRTPLNRERQLVERLHNVLVCDISRGGMAIFVPSLSKAFFDVKSPVRLVSLGIHKLGTVVRGEVLYRVPFDIKGTLANRSGFKVGIQFQTELDASLIEQFLTKRNIFSITEERIVKDEQFRRHVVAQMNEIKKSIWTKKKFDSFFSSLDRPKAENHYLKQHIHLLCQVMSGLGTKLGWISERSIDKLIYVAYLHDIRFATQPHMARVQSKREFDKIKHTLTHGEQTAFLESPNYSADLARQDLESYPDVIKILEQQKELPDGTGFPHALTSSQIAPLSALFIVSHYLVDYVIDHPDWTPLDFVKTYRSRLKGQYFQKILHAIEES